jgi:oligoendopeptidase F
MKKRLFLPGVLAVLLMLSQMSMMAQTRERSEVPEEYTWRLEDLYASDEAWRAEKERLEGEMDKVLQFKGALANSPADLLACMQFNSQFSKEFSRLYSYAFMKSDQDTRNSKYLAIKQEMQQMATDYRTKRSFIDPELVAMDKATIEKFMAEKPELKEYRMYLFDLQRKKEHRLSEKEEKILAEAGLMAPSASNIYNVFSNAELPYPEIELGDGSKVTLNQAGYGRYRASTNREDREAVFDAFWDTFNRFRGTFGVQLYSNVKSDMFYARARNYESSLESALDVNNIPTDVYLALIENVSNNLDYFHRYLELKKRMLGVDTLKYSDIYAPAVKGVDLQYSVEEAHKLVLEAVKPLGDDYYNAVKESFEKRWIDMYPTPGKRSGAYSAGDAYDVHPYILMNYNGQYNDVSTLAHEIGHAMHSLFSNRTQPYPRADYPIFVAEVASTFNEALLINKVLKNIKDENVRLSLLMNYLDNLKGTLFRQTQFAEFELRIHEKAERGEPLTGDVLTELYGEILKKYYGHDKGICYIDDLYCVEWAYIPHFYYNFYVYQYSTSFTASTALAEKVINKEKGAVEKYLDFISSGGSDYPIELLKKAGVDMTTPEPFDKTMQAMGRTMDEIELILKKLGSS